MSAAEDKKKQGVIQLRHETSAGGDIRYRYNDGWRAGKPEEDPEKLKKWGTVTARPSEYLIHMRRGVVLQGSSGQGASCFKWPWDAVAIVPTTVQRLQFVADQVTSEKVGVQVTGLAVYRISDPIIAYRMLNFSFPERASEKLEHLLVEMFVGAARRLVANLSVEECLTRRKEGIAEELMREIAPVVSGKGSLNDSTDKGWGVVLDTIEIQDVRVLSPTVFNNMQAPYRQEQERRAREAELAREEAIKQHETENERVIALQKLASQNEVRQKVAVAEEQSKLAELAAQARVIQAKTEAERNAQAQRVQLELEKIATENEVRAKKQAAEEQAKHIELQTAARLAELKAAQERKLQEQRAQAELEKLHHEQQVAEERQGAEERMRLAELQLQQRLMAAQLEHERATMHARMQAEVEKAQLEAQALSAKHEAELALIAQQAEVEKMRSALAAARRSTVEEEVRIAELEAQRARFAQEQELERQKALREIENTVSPEAIQLAVAQQLPQVAAGFAQKMGNVNVTAIDGANPFGFVAAAVEGVMGLAKNAGLKLPEVKSQQ